MTAGSRPSEEHRRVRRLEQGWRFHRGDVENGEDPALDDSNWESVEVPHDWSIEGPWDPDNPGDQQQGFAPGGIGWYRRELPDDVDGEPTLRLDGVYRNFDVYVDGEHVGHRPYGYSTVTYDLAEFGVEGGETLAVRVDNDEYPHSRWYTGSGIYRNAHLIETDSVAVTPFGTDVRTTAANGRRAEVQVLTEVENAEDGAVDCALETDIVDADGEIVATAGSEATVDAGEAHEFEQRLSVADPDRWTLDDPTRHFARSVVYRNGEPVDDYVTPFGIRTFEWTSDQGFYLNGEPVTMKGVNLHHDAGCLGAAVPERALERRLETLQEIGCNAIRMSHNPPQPELLDLCDRKGFLVIDESFDKWRHEGADEWFDEWWREDLAAMVDRDRNHPSIVCWSVGNESYDQGDDSMLDDLAMLTEATSEMDPTRPVTYGAAPWGGDTAGMVAQLEDIGEHVDILSCNYQEQWFEAFREAGLDKPIISSEAKPFFLGGEDEDIGFIAENPWFGVADNDFVAGQFIWSGIDYLGESREWPNKGWATGLIDTTGAPKPETGFHESVWSDEPMVQIAAFDPDRDRPAGRPNWSWPAVSEHWTFPGREGSRDFVHLVTFTNAETVELYCNGEWMGERDLADTSDRMIEWYVPYEAGTLRAVAKEDGEVVAEHELETAGEPARVELDADRETIAADGRDLVYVEATVTDDEGVRVPRADDLIRFSASGAGDIVGVDNGDLDSDEPYVAESRSAYHGTCVAVVQADRDGGPLEIAAEADGLDGDSVRLAVGSDD
ncbi:glycoside hydrolase family 2 TIM barrel-domain containing protein [Halosimplex sp. TS25]|uniref:glycoside hydrolase family 2 TIM barrel-domain containing protein n=1 Tax=Halosimplex rarum TaxID=3396619 RepID=UPI0039EA8141